MDQRRERGGDQREPRRHREVLATGAHAGADPGTAATAQPVPAYGTGFALLYIPRLRDKVWGLPIHQGTSKAILAQGAGHYRGTAMPGQVGNFAIAAHRSTHDEPFANFPDLQAGDKVYVQTRTQWYVYTLSKDDPNLSPTDVWVVDPVPGKPGRDPDAEAHHHDHLHAALRVDRSVGVVGRSSPHEPVELAAHRTASPAPPDRRISDTARRTDPRPTRTPVYAWIWRKLPGPWPVKLVEALVAFAVVVLLLFTVVFPWLEPRLPFNDVTVDDGPTSSAPATP